jgi:hypothetical protein
MLSYAPRSACVPKQDVKVTSLGQSRWMLKVEGKGTELDRRSKGLYEDLRTHYV